VRECCRRSETPDAHESSELLSPPMHRDTRKPAVSSLVTTSVVLPCEVVAQVDAYATAIERTREQVIYEAVEVLLFLRDELDVSTDILVVEKPDGSFSQIHFVEAL
jgi:hypothetical protein